MRALRLLAVCAVVAATATSATAQRRQRLEVVADGHPLTVWSIRPSQPRGAILLLHGRTWSSLPNFDLQVDGGNRSVMRALAQRGYAVYALDQRGYGATPRDQSGWLTPLRAVKDISIVLRWIKQREAGRPPVLAGYSRGAVMSLLAAQLYPADIAKLVLYAFVRDIDEKSSTEEPPGEPRRQATTAEMARSDFITPAAVTPQVVDAYVRQALAADPIRVDWRGEHELNALDPSTVQLPALIIRGALDHLASVEKDTKLFSRLGTPDRSLVLLPAADHAAHVEDAHEAWIDAVVSFIERPRTSGRTR